MIKSSVVLLDWMKWPFTADEDLPCNRQKLGALLRFTFANFIWKLLIQMTRWGLIEGKFLGYSRFQKRPHSKQTCCTGSNSIIYTVIYWVHTGNEITAMGNKNEGKLENENKGHRGLWGLWKFKLRFKYKYPKKVDVLRFKRCTVNLCKGVLEHLLL